eukprot:CAMPEP_0113706674 /NCGR_PEP_ID=MMETSP0038_2-20120614/27873_1 /TAXON_ID=2898 /ORGANISM="Cryptomonas paramecium" /LENGTH=421 /DNA_ID=CAMNT_0000631927 /DNA_START=47 /DNA_END=1309 /DNA_ORIENTATION=- /assembly_acc=CAM_ASM_000170
MACPVSTEKSHYVVGGWLPGTGDQITAKLKLLFEGYLNSYFMSHFNGSATFEFIPVDYDEASYANHKIKTKELDFLYTLAGRMVCVQAEFGWIPVATERVDVLGLETGAQGTVVFSLKSNTRIRNISDMKNSMVGVGYLLSSNAYHFGYKLLREHGVNIFIDVSKLVFYETDYADLLGDVVKEKIDVGMLPSSWLFENAGELLESELLVHSPRVYEYEGETFPFPTSTPLTPQYGVSASLEVPWRVKLQVARALANLTRDHPAAAAADIATFTAPGHFDGVREGLESLGLLRMPSLESWEEGDVHATCHSPFADVIDTIQCPAGHVLQDARTVAHRCVDNRLECPAGRVCFCRPCQKDLEVRVFPARVVLSLALTIFSLTLLLSFCWVFPLETFPYAAAFGRRLQRRAAPVLTRIIRPGPR